MSQGSRVDGDTPPGGDFASYVERLSAGAAATPPGRQTQAHEEHTRLKPPAVSGAAAGTSDASHPSFFFMALRGVRVLLLLVAGLQVVGLLGGRLDSWVGLLIVGGFWLALGFVQKIASAVLSTVGKASSQAGLAQLQQQLAQLSQQRPKGKRK